VDRGRRRKALAGGSCGRRKAGTGGGCRETDPITGASFWRAEGTSNGSSGSASSEEDGDDDDDVSDARRPGSILVAERATARQFQSSEEILVVQYLALKRGPDTAGSGIHSGAGRQTFGWGPSQRADLLMSFYGSPSEGAPATLVYHNFHGGHWSHSRGHRAGCPRAPDDGGPSDFKENLLSARKDSFRLGLAAAWSRVAPQNVVFRYETSHACDYFHGREVAGALTGQPYADLRQALASEGGPSCWIPRTVGRITEADLTEAIRTGRAEGFATVIGGRENPESRAGPAEASFGFCVQSWAPPSENLGEFTLRQIAEHHGWSWSEPGGRRKTRQFVEKQPPRTLNDLTFRSEETVSTVYLRWLMEERGFSDFRITHFMAYEFRSFGEDFIEDVLIRRHREKRRKNAVAAECLKLIGNGSYGYNALESCNYSTVKLIEGASLQKRLGSDLSHLSWRHVSLLGVVRKQVRKAKKRKKTKRSAPDPETGARAAQPRSRRGPGASFLSDEAVVEGDDTSEEEEEEEEEEDRVEGSPDPEDDRDSELSSASEEEEEEEAEEERTTFRAHVRQLEAGPSALGARGIPPLEWAIDRVQRGLSCQGPSVEAGALADHSYARRGVDVGTEARAKRAYDFLYAVCFSGERKLIKNTLPKAVAILSNSKRLFLGHVNVLLRCLDPRKAELCYIDTDSCIFSLSESRLENCLLPERLPDWTRADILADESGPESCHGKLKLEGTFAYGEFRSLKMYRLWRRAPASDAPEVFTRCKGVTRATAGRLPDACFETREDRDRTVVHRTSLRPTRAGEIWMVREGRRLSVPFNFKRRVTSDGLHSLPLSADLGAHGEPPDELPEEH